MIDAVVPSLNTLYSQRFQGSIGYQAATEVTDQGLSRSNSYESMESKQSDSLQRSTILEL